MTKVINTEPRRRRIGCLIPALTVLMFFVGCTAYFEYVFDPCDTTIHSVNASPDTNFKVIIYSVGCGATTPYSTQANLIPADQKFKRESEQRFLSLRGLHNITIRWLDAKTVEFVFEDIKKILDEEKVYLREETKDGISIVYK